jgi:hypothetical protein
MDGISGDIRERGPVEPGEIREIVKDTGWAVFSGSQARMDTGLRTFLLPGYADHLVRDVDDLAVIGQVPCSGEDGGGRQNYGAIRIGRKAVRGIVDFEWRGSSPEIVREYPKVAIAPDGNKGEPRRIVANRLPLLANSVFTRWVESAIELIPEQRDGSVILSYLETGDNDANNATTVLPPHSDGARWILSYAEHMTDAESAQTTLHSREQELVASFQQGAGDIFVADDTRFSHGLSHKGLRRALVLAFPTADTQVWMRDYYSRYEQPAHAA